MRSTPSFLTPLLVASYGRSGSTLLMQLLTSCDEVAAERVYPYEARYLTYFLRWCTLPFAQEHRRDLWNSGDMMTEGTPSLMGAFPWNDTESEIIPRGGGSFPVDAFHALWERFSALRPDARYYAEKIPLWLGQRIGEVFPNFRTLYLVRDPRDVWLSIQAFDKKRGFFGFGRLEGEPVDDYRARFFADQRQRFVTLATLQQETPAHRLIRYEDLADNLPSAAATLSDWLGVRLDAEAVIARRPQMAHHITSDDQSVRRWQREMAADEQAIFADALGEVLDPFYGS